MNPTFALLTFAIVSLWFGSEGDPAWRRWLWIAPYIAAIVAGVASAVVAPIGVIWITLFAGAAMLFYRSSSARGQRTFAAIAIVLLSAGLMAHQLPGFNNPRVISAMRFTADAVPFRLHLNFDKATVGLFLLGFGHARIRHITEWRGMLGKVGPTIAVLVGAIMVLSLTIGYVRWELKFPREAWLWMWVNLCFTCVAEEALFRGFVQRELQRAWRDVRGGTWLALSVASVLFGVAHAAGGPVYVVLATIGGAGYGWAYLRTGRIEASILAHFALNTAHFFGFTYPALERTV